MMLHDDELIQRIVEVLENASREDLELFIIIIDGYLRKKDKQYVRQTTQAESSAHISCVSEAEWSKFVLRALINYHDRMTMCDEQDPFNKGLRYALALVEKEIQK